MAKERTPISRRQFLRTLDLAWKAVLLAACAGEAPKIPTPNLPGGETTEAPMDSVLPPIDPSPQPEKTVAKIEGGPYSPEQKAVVEEWTSRMLRQNDEWQKAANRPWGEGVTLEVQEYFDDRDNPTIPGSRIVWRVKGSDGNYATVDVNGKAVDTFTFPHPQGMPLYDIPIPEGSEIRMGNGPLPITRDGTIQAGIYSGQEYRLGGSATSGFTRYSKDGIILQIIGPTGEWVDVKQEVKDVVAASSETVRAEVLGVPVQFELVVDKNLAERKNFNVNRIFLNQNFPDASKAVCQAYMMGLFYAWQNNDPAQKTNRTKTTFEQWMEKVKGYTQGNVGLDEVKVAVYANDLAQAGYSEELRYISPTIPGRLVVVDRGTPFFMDHLTDMDKNMDDAASTHIRQSEGQTVLEMWSSWPTKSAGRSRATRTATAGFLTSLNRLGLHEYYEVGKIGESTRLQYLEVKWTHPEMCILVVQEEKLESGKKMTGALQVEPNDYNGQ